MGFSDIYNRQQDISFIIIKERREYSMDYLAGKLLSRLPQIMEDIAKLDRGQSSMMQMMFPTILSDDELAVITGSKYMRNREIYR